MGGEQGRKRLRAVRILFFLYVLRRIYFPSDNSVASYIRHSYRNSVECSSKCVMISDRNVLTCRKISYFTSRSV
jgi:hypothetical protein